MREFTQNAELIVSAVEKTIRQAKRHPISLGDLTRDVAREIGSRKTPKIMGVIDTLVEKKLVLVLTGTGDEYYWKANLDSLKTRLCDVLKTHANQNPLSPFIKSKEVMKRFSKTKTAKIQRNIDPRLFALAIEECKQSGLLKETHEGLALVGENPQRHAEELQRLLGNKVLTFVTSRTHQRLNIENLANELGLRPPAVKKLLKDLVSEGKLVYIEDGRYLKPDLVDRAKSLLRTRLAQKEGAHVSELMKLFSVPRRGTIALLEYFDRAGYTKREGELRVLAP